MDKHDYKRIKESLSRDCTELRSRIADLKATESGFQEYYHYGISLLSNMGQYYRAANIENRQKMLGLIFPEKLVFDNNTFQTMKPSEVSCFAVGAMDSAVLKKKRAAIKLLSPVW
ncbi:MAG: hypothetical protein IPI98_04490 [Chitinophagaceae bacterium]|nr:hypothetical protein [Chitinophagaceae bacterium]